MNDVTAVAGPDLFRGTAGYYARYRPGYPPELVEAIRERLGLDGTGTLLDLGTGTGLLCLPLARQFARVLGVDPDADMLAHARAAAQRQGVANVEWQQARAEELDLPPGSVRLVTIGGAFHWMDRDAVATRCAGWLEPGGGLVLAGVGGVWSGNEPWEQTVVAIIQRWLGEGRRPGAGTLTPSAERHEDVLRRSSPFGQTVERCEFMAERRWTLDSLLGLLYSTSFARRDLLGDKVDGFEQDLRTALLAVVPDGAFVERAKCELIIARKE